MPNHRERAAILTIHGRGKNLGADVDLDAVSRGTPGFSGADLANLVNEAAINAVRADRDVLSAADFDAVYLNPSPRSKANPRHIARAALMFRAMTARNRSGLSRVARSARSRTAHRD